jgi:hypothetical protein
VGELLGVVDVRTVTAMCNRVILAAAILAIAGHAHEIGTTRISATLRPDRTYDIEIVADASALADKLGGRFDETPFRERVKVLFDGGPVQPAIAYSVTPPAATIRLTGEIPPRARQFAWSYGWTFASYALTVGTGASGPPVTQLIV